MSQLISLCFVFLSFMINAQSNWVWTELDTMPIRTSNNAVCEVLLDGHEYVYSFGGIDTSKLASGIHQRSFKYDVSSNTWNEISQLPDTLGKIASAASYVKGKIYIIGGYHVLESGTEITSNKVHVFNPSTDLFESDGENLPKAIDDHVQAVWRDSLIYVVTGWSNTTNQPDVQIYNPTTDNWLNGTSLPNNNTYKAFGASGTIIGDTIFYYGGVSSSNFLAQSFMRKGVIDQNDPTSINWSLLDNTSLEKRYRAACSNNNQTIFWVGGANTGYNFDGLAYFTNSGVEPLPKILEYNQSFDAYFFNNSEPYGVMDLRGIAKLENKRWIICGGMDSLQQVSNRTFLLANPELGLNENTSLNTIINYSKDYIEIIFKAYGNSVLVDNAGRIIKYFKGQNIFIDRSNISRGVYFIKSETESIKILN